MTLQQKAQQPPTKATRAQFLRELAKHAGATEDTVNNTESIMVDTPPGKRWEGDDIHCLVEPFTLGAAYPGSSHKPEAYAAIIDRMSSGMIDCSDGKDCDVCYPDEEK